MKPALILLTFFSELSMACNPRVMDCEGSSSAPWWFNPFIWFAVFLVISFAINSVKKLFDNPLKGIAYMLLRIAMVISIFLPFIGVFIFISMDWEINGFLYFLCILFIIWMGFIFLDLIGKLNERYFSMEENEKGKWD